MTQYKAIAMFGSASDNVAQEFRKPVFETAALLAQKGITMIYGVGDSGLMGESFKGARSAGGKVLGVTIPSLLHKQCKDTSIFGEGELLVVDTLHERKHIMMESADALLIAPGGWGTMDEIASQGVHAKLGDRTEKPVIFLNFNGFWDPMKQLLENMQKSGTVLFDQIDFVDFANTPQDIFQSIERTNARLKK